MQRRRFIGHASAASFAAVLAGPRQTARAQDPASELPPPRTIAQLAQWAAEAGASQVLERVRELPATDTYTAYLVAYKVAGLRLHALVAQPRSPGPPTGYRVLVANHGFHPNPPRYGYSAAGVDSRPGDYYREVPSLYCAGGFLVVMPDYRGHSNSEGAQFTSRPLAAAYYSEDVVGLMRGLPSLPSADTSRVFMWGHSMGGDVTLRALLAGIPVRGASLWSTSGSDPWEQAYFYSRYQDLGAEDNLDRAKEPMDRLRAQLNRWGADFDIAGIDPVAHLQRLRTPLIIHHALGDKSTDYRWSMRLAKDLYRHRLPYTLHTYAGDSHFFEGVDRRLAVERDLRHFRALMTAAR